MNLVRASTNRCRHPDDPGAVFQDVQGVLGEIAACHILDLLMDRVYDEQEDGTRPGDALLRCNGKTVDFKTVFLDGFSAWLAKTGGKVIKDTREQPKFAEWKIWNRIVAIEELKVPAATKRLQGPALPAKRIGDPIAAFTLVPGAWAFEGLPPQRQEKLRTLCILDEPGNLRAMFDPETTAKSKVDPEFTADWIVHTIAKCI